MFLLSISFIFPAIFIVILLCAFKRIMTLWSNINQYDFYGWKTSASFLDCVILWLLFRKKKEGFRPGRYKKRNFLQDIHDDRPQQCIDRPVPSSYRGDRVPHEPGHHVQKRVFSSLPWRPL